MNDSDLVSQRIENTWGILLATRYLVIKKNVSVLMPVTSEPRV